MQTQPAGKQPTVDFRFRNGTKVSFEAHAIKVDKLLDDVKAYLNSNPGRLDWQRSTSATSAIASSSRTSSVSRRQGRRLDVDLKPRPEPRR